MARADGEALRHRHDSLVVLAQALREVERRWLTSNSPASRLVRTRQRAAVEIPQFTKPARKRRPNPTPDWGHVEGVSYHG